MAMTDEQVEQVLETMKKTADALQTMALDLDTSPDEELKNMRRVNEKKNLVIEDFRRSVELLELEERFAANNIKTPVMRFPDGRVLVIPLGLVDEEDPEEIIRRLSIPISRRGPVGEK
jgi:hypothetical protein